MAQAKAHAQWGSRLGFILAASGAAVGLGNIWKFPYTAGEFGGGAFVLIYLLSAALMGWPIMVSEFMIGRRGQRDPIGSFSTVADEVRASRSWGLVGAIGVLSAVLILSYYSVVGGWTFEYFERSVSGDHQTEELIQDGARVIQTDMLPLEANAPKRFPDAVDARDYVAALMHAFSNRNLTDEELASIHAWRKDRSEQLEEAGKGALRAMLIDPDLLEDVENSTRIERVKAAEPWTEGTPLDPTNRLPNTSVEPAMDRIVAILSLENHQGQQLRGGFDYREDIPDIIRALIIAERERDESINRLSTEELKDSLFQFLQLMRLVESAEGGTFTTEKLSEFARLYDVKVEVREAARNYLKTKAAAGQFGSLSENTGIQTLWHIIFMIITMAVVALGVQRGIEVFTKIMMPLLLLLIFFLVGYSFAEGEAGAALSYLFVPNWDNVSGETVSRAMGQAFFSLSIGIGTLLAYGSYLSKQTPLGSSAAIVVSMDTGIALLSGIIIFSILFGFGGAPDEGPGLMFVSMPVLFADMPGGSFIGPSFFLLLIFAALTSSISILEVPVSVMMKRLKMSRPVAALTAGLGIGLVGWLIIALARHIDLFDIFGKITDQITLPLAGVLTAVFAGFRISREVILDEFKTGSPTTAAYYRLAIRFVTPIVAGVVLVVSVYTLFAELFGF